MQRSVKKETRNEPRASRRLHAKSQRCKVAAFSHLEIAHVLGQQFLLPHITVHAWMLRVAAKKGRIGARCWARSRGLPRLFLDSSRAGCPWAILAAPMYRHSNPCRFPLRFQVWFQSRT
ncbi:MAG: hypothetical protein B7X53_14545 [Hyphomonas sp. 34-62-18]|nr:MAG: hypothetical protein B7X53_14545 [Hyphomonas sp. 34-62-18]